MKKHVLDGISFFSGLAIAAIGLLFLITSTPSDVIYHTEPGKYTMIDMITGLAAWFLPLTFVVVGLAVTFPVLILRKSKGKNSPKSTS